MTKSRLCMAAAAAVTGTLLLPSTPTVASVLPSPDPPSSIQLTADNGTTMIVTGAERVEGHDYQGKILIDKIEPPSPDLYPSDILIWFDLDNDDVPDVMMETSSIGVLYSRRVTTWDDPAPVDITNRGCFGQTQLEITYDTTCLNAGESMRVSAVMATSAEQFPIGGLRAWSSPVATPSYAWDYCKRSVGELQPGSGSLTVLHYTAVNKVSCAKGATVLRKAYRAFRKDERAKIRVGKFTCTFPNLISAQIDCKHRENRKRWAYSWSMP